MTPRQIAEKHHALFCQGGVGVPTLLEHFEQAILEALDTLDDKHLASALKQAEADRDGWFRAHLRRGEELGEAQAALDKLKAEFDAYKAMMHDRGP